MDVEKLTVDQLKKFAQAEKQKAAHVKANLGKASKSAAQLDAAAKVVAEISKKNPEL